MACDCDAFFHVQIKIIPINTADIANNTTGTTILIASAVVFTGGLLNDFPIVASVLRQCVCMVHMFVT